MAMTDAQVKALKAQEKKYAVSDGHGLILEVRPNGAKYWIVRMWRNGKEIRRHLGSYPQMSVKEARIKAAEEHDRISEKKGKSITLGELAEEWLKTRMTDKKPSYLESIRMRLRLYVLPEFENTPVTEINSADILNLCRKLEERKTIETAARVKVLIGQIIRYAIATNRAVNDPTTALKNALATRQHKHMAALTKPSDIALLMKNINAYPRTLIRCALKFSALTFCRPGEIRHAKWSEIDFENSEWRIPAEKMKMKRTHIVPLSRQAVEILQFLKKITGKGKWIFPSARMDGNPMSEKHRENCPAFHGLLE